MNNDDVKTVDETKPDETTEEVKTTQTEPQNLDADKVVDKLQKRIGKEQAEKNEAKEQLEQALKRIADLEKQANPDVKTLSDQDEQQKKDKEIEELRNQLRLSEVRQQTADVLKEAGLSVDRDLLDVIANVDDKQTFANAKALINFANKVAENTRTEYLKGNTPKEVGKPAKTMTKAEIMAIKDDFKRKQAIAENFELFTKGSH